MSTFIEYVIFSAIASLSLYSTSSVASFGITVFSAASLTACVGGAAYAIYLLLMKNVP